MPTATYPALAGALPMLLRLRTTAVEDVEFLIAHQDIEFADVWLGVIGTFLLALDEELDRRADMAQAAAAAGKVRVG